MYGVIYKIENKINNKVYIGQSVYKQVFKFRYDYNIYKATNNPILKRSILKHGIENFELNECIDIAYNKEHLDELEKHYIMKYDSTNLLKGYNLKQGGANGKWNDEIKNKISFSQLGELNSFYGKTHTEQVRNNISKARSKRVWREDGAEFDSCKDASIKCNIHKDAISKCCRGIYKQAGGFKWSYNPPTNGMYTD